MHQIYDPSISPTAYPWPSRKPVQRKLLRSDLSNIHPIKLQLRNQLISQNHVRTKGRKIKLTSTTFG